jgi:hypothetical protein
MKFRTIESAETEVTEKSHDVALARSRQIVEAFEGLNPKDVGFVLVQVVPGARSLIVNSNLSGVSMSRDQATIRVLQGAIDLIGDSETTGHLAPRCSRDPN